jgi:putative sterol carrier protein
MGGKLKIKGDMGLAMKLEKLMNQMNSKLWLNFILFLSGI